ncbi:putative transcriptional regulator [Azospirillum oryzae]|uniref:Putative transcriptional regulator n=1 Tax=Azospirillum oryzae TaxID=286727 RepID=A0A1X7GQK1_9PROT|nr:helix-turn-helix domain-containing protein [Azospirillum oryzae]SMF73074.1 putative transcriptional regulator [Azospirillum oryzae]
MATVKVTKEMAADALRGIDWAAVDATTDEEIARQVADNPDAAPILSDAELDRARFGERVKAIRERLRLTQPAFAERFGFPTASLRDWEQGRRKPDAATTAYLAVIEHEPEAVMRALEKSRAA